MHHDFKKYTGFSTPDGHYKFFGFKNAPSEFNRIMQICLRVLGSNTEVYFDDIIIYSKTFEQHLFHVAKVLDKIRKTDLRLRVEMRLVWSTSKNIMSYSKQRKNSHGRN